MAQAEEIRTETGPLDYDYTEKEVELCHFQVCDCGLEDDAVPPSIPSDRDSSSGINSDPGECYAFQEGNCPRGNNCRFSHSGGGGGGRGRMACLPARPREQNDGILESSASHLSAVRVTTPSSSIPSSSGVQNRLSFYTPAARARGLHCLSSSQRWINFWQPGTRPHGLSVCSLPDSIWKAWSSAQAADFALWRSGTRLSKTISSDSCNLQRKLFHLSVPRADSACLARFQRIPASARNAAIARISTDDARLRDPVFLDLAVDGLLNGANLCYEGPRSGSARLDNYSSATSHSEFVTGELDKEL
eukprot:g17972.t1